MDDDRQELTPAAPAVRWLPVEIGVIYLNRSDPPGSARPDAGRGAARPIDFESKPAGSNDPAGKISVFNRWANAMRFPLNTNRS
jgi:hypothetical protein